MKLGDYNASQKAKNNTDIKKKKKSYASTGINKITIVPNTMEGKVIYWGFTSKDKFSAKHCSIHTLATSIKLILRQTTNMCKLQRVSTIKVNITVICSWCKSSRSETKSTILSCLLIFYMLMQHCIRCAFYRKLWMSWLLGKHDLHFHYSPRIT